MTTPNLDKTIEEAREEVQELVNELTTKIREKWPLYGLMSDDSNLMGDIVSIFIKHSSKHRLGPAGYQIIERIRELEETLRLIQDMDASANPGPAHVSVWSVAEQALSQTRVSGP